MASDLNTDEQGRHIGTSPSATARSGFGAPLIGRDDELQLLLQELYDLLAGGGAQLVTVVGAPGIGKSRLAHELRQVAARLPDSVGVLSLQADSQSTLQPYSLVRRLVAALFRIRDSASARTVRARLEAGVSALLGPDSAEKAHLIGQLAGYDVGDSAQLWGYLAEPRRLRDQALVYAGQCLAAYTAQTPLLLILDDFHLADDGSLDAIAQVVAAERRASLLVVCLAQQRLYERRPIWPGRRIELAPLDEPAGQRLVGEILRKAGKLPADLRAMIVSRAAGNPYYTEELIKILIADGVIVPGPETWQIRPGRLSSLRIPSTLAEILQSRLQALLPAEREFLLRAAVVGRFFWADAAPRLGAATGELGAAEGADAVTELLASLERKDLVAPRPESRFPGQREYIFRHELLHEAAYAQVPPDIRQVYHRKVAEWLVEHCGERATAYAGLVAKHYERGGHLRQAATWALKAGDYARETSAVEVALDHYQAALALLPDDDEAVPAKIACLEGLGETQAAIARLGDAATSFRRMAELADQCNDRSAAARAWNGLAYVLDSNFDYLAAEASARRACALAEAAGDDRQLALALYHVAWAELRGERPQAALSHGRRALAILAHVVDPPVVARCTAMIGVAYEQLGDHDAARRSLLEVLRYYREVDSPQQVAGLLNNLGFVANVQGDYDAALGFLHEGLRLAREGRMRLNEIYLLNNLADALNGLGDYVLAEAEARCGLDLCAASRITAPSGFFVAIAEACLGQDRVTDAAEAAQQALDSARAGEGPRNVAAACRALGLAISAMSDSQGARPCFEESARLFTESGAQGEHARTLRAWAYYELRSGDGARGRTLYRQARELFATLGLGHELARTPAEPGAGEVGA